MAGLASGSDEAQKRDFVRQNPAYVRTSVRAGEPPTIQRALCAKRDRPMGPIRGGATMVRSTIV